VRRVEAEEAAARALSHHLAATLTPPQVRPASREWFEGRGVSTSRVIDPTRSTPSLSAPPPGGHTHATSGAASFTRVV
jgi:hypothetical protein